MQNNVTLYRNVFSYNFLFVAKSAYFNVYVYRHII